MLDILKNLAPNTGGSYSTQEKRIWAKLIVVCVTSIRKQMKMLSMMLFSFVVMWKMTMWRFSAD